MGNINESVGMVSLHWWARPHELTSPIH